jgi:hypothetical protein
MKKTPILIVLICLLFTVNAEAQLLKKLKKKAEQAAERTILNKTVEVVSETTEKTIDDATSKKDTSSENNKEDSKNTKNHSEITSGNAALERNTQAKKDFYKEDVVVKLHENGKLNQAQYFDADQVAVRLEQKDQPKGGYIDSEGFMYGYNESEGAFNKSSMIASSTQGMMLPNMLLSAYKLPPEPFMANYQKQTDQGLTANPFNGIVEFAFVYEPEQFRYEDFKEVKQTLRGKSYIKFEYLNEPGYEGSYVLFDDQNRLVEIYANKSDTGEPMDGFNMDITQPGESLLVYEYKSVDVQLPPAREVKAQGQGLMEMVYGSFKKDKNTGDLDEDDYDTSDSKGQVKSVKKAWKNHKVTEKDLPQSYDFDWQYQTEMVMASRKKDVIDMTFLIKEGATYQGMQVVDRKSKDMGNMTMLFDSDLNSMIMFMDMQGNSMLQIYPIPEPRKTDDKVDFKVTKLAPKTILKYNCKGLQIEDDRYIIKVYHTTETTIKLGNFMSFSGAKNIDLPDLDPKMVKQFSGGLIMEMEMIDKKKSKNNVTITATSIKKDPLSIEKENYQSMNLLSGGKMLKN